MNSLDTIAPCGTDCKTCSHFDNDCEGCRQRLGNPFWGKQFGMDICPIWDCAVNERKIEHCGNCGDFPCQNPYLDLRDPSMSDEEWDACNQERRENLEMLKKS